MPWRPRGTESERFAQFCKRFLKTPKGHGALKPFELRDWQIDLVASVLDAEVRPRLAGWLLGRGNGKSTLLAAWAVYTLFCEGEGTRVVVCATDQRQAGLIFNTSRRFVELSDELSARCQIGKERLYIPRTDSMFDCLPASPPALEGLDANLILLDEAGVVPRELYEVLTLGQGKRPRSTLVAVGTPPPDPTDSVLTDLRQMHADLGDEYIAWREFSADGFQSHPASCEHCIRLANPAVGDFLALDSFTTLLKTTRENSYRRSRLCQFVNDTTGEFLPHGTWDGLSTGQPVPDGADVVLALDGSFNEDSTGLLVVSIGPVPHVDVVQLWAKPAGDDDWRAPILEIEDTIRAACKRWKVYEIVSDPYLFNRTLQILAGEGLPVVEFPHSPARLTAATTDLFKACVNATITHSGDSRLAAHVGNAVVMQDSRGMRLSKASRSTKALKIDLAACLVMGYSRASWRANQHQKRKRTVSFK